MDEEINDYCAKWLECDEFDEESCHIIWWGGSGCFVENNNSIQRTPESLGVSETESSC